MGIRNVFLLLMGALFILVLGGASCGGPSPIPEDPPNQQPSINIGLVLSDYSLVLTQGGKASILISVSADRDVNLSYGSLPNGVTAAFSKNSTSSSSTLSFSAADDAQIGQFDVFLEGQTGNTTQLETLSLEIRKKVNSNSALEIAFSGLPGPWEYGGYLIVEGPNQFRKAVFDSQTLDNLEAGEYTFTVPNLSICGSNYGPKFLADKLTLTENNSESLFVPYIGVPQVDAFSTQGFKADISGNHSVSIVTGEIDFIFDEGRLETFGCETDGTTIRDVNILEGHAKDHYITRGKSVGVGKLKVSESCSEGSVCTSYIHDYIMFQDGTLPENLYVEISMFSRYGDVIPLVLRQIIDDSDNSKKWGGGNLSVYNDGSSLPEDIRQYLKLFGPVTDLIWDEISGTSIIRPLETVPFNDIYAYDFIIESTHGDALIDCSKPIPVRYNLMLNGELTNIVEVRRGQDINVAVTYLKDGTNDDYSNACLLTDSRFDTEGTISGKVTGNNTVATRQVDEPIIVDASGSSVWWKLSNSPTQTTSVVTLDTLGSDFDTLIAVYERITVDRGQHQFSSIDDNYQFELVASNDDGYTSSGASRVDFELSKNSFEDYYVLVDGYLGEVGNVVLNWSVTSKANVN